MPYFQAHPIKVLTDQPLCHAPQNPDTFEHLIQWSVELGEFDIKCLPRLAMKGQILADFVAEYTYPEPTNSLEEVQPWILHIDGSTTKDASGVGLVLVSPEQNKLAYALCFEFKATNNEVEYEALTTRMQLAKVVGTKHLTVISDSQLVVGQVTREYEAREETMMTYLTKV